MNERTYGGMTLEDIDVIFTNDVLSAYVPQEMATHIRELQAELAELKLQHIASVSQVIELQAVASALYQIFGVYDAPENVLDLVLAAAQGEALPCDSLDLLPFSLDEEKLKAERREFGLRVAARVNSYSEIPLHDATITAIVEQELNK